MVLQVVNGPCPIIALCSVLFLRGELVLKADVHEVSFEQLCALLRDHLQRSVQAVALRPGASEEAVANALQNLEEVSALLPRLEQGLDINVRFSSPAAFEFTPELSLFDLAGVRLLHGWCYDAEDRDTARVLSNMSYNELVNFITSEDAPPTPAKPRSQVRNAAAGAAVIAAATAPAAISASAVEPIAEETPVADKPPAAAEVPPAATETAAVPAASLATPAPVPALSSAVPVSELKEDLEALHIESLTASSAPSSTTAAHSAASTAAAAPAVESASSSSEPEPASASASAFTSSSAFFPSSSSSTAASSTVPSTVSSSPPLSSAALEAKSLRLAQTYQDKNVARAFLNDTQSQLTIAGLSMLHSLMRTDELAVLFRNNHFAVLLKRNDRLYTLVSDFGLLAAAPYIVWSFVSDTQGDHLFLDHDWKIPHPTTVDYWQRQDQRQPTAAMAGNHSPLPPQQQQQQIYQPPPQQSQQQYRQQRPQSSQSYNRQPYQQPQPQQPAPRPVAPQRKRDSCVVQ